MKKNLCFVCICLITCAFGFVQNARTKIVTLDNYYNHEVNKEGEVWHYTWDDTSMSGFSQLGSLFQKAGGTLRTLTAKPTVENLKNSLVYIIVDPDTESESPHPNYMDEAAAQAIMAWVENGGKLVLFTNDKGNCDLQKINILSEKAGIHFNENSISNERPFTSDGKRFFDDCAFTEFTKHPLFKGVKKILLKGICTMDCTKPAHAILTTKEGDIVVAEAKIKKGRVIAVTDPWLYNEYLEHTSLPEGFTNDVAAANLVKWLLQ